MAIYRGTGGTGDSTTDATIQEVTQQAVNAQDSADAAALSASAAASSISDLKDLTTSTTTLPEGSQATSSYDDQTGVLSLGLPTGDTGPQGIQGIQGDTGPQGIQGIQGPAGADSDMLAANNLSELTNFATARSNLGLVIGTDVEAFFSKSTGFNKNLGTTSGTVSEGDHNHTGVYEPADATIVKDADIGVTVLAPNGDGSNLTGIDALPTQTGNNGKFLTTDGANADWVDVDALPSQTGNSGKVLTTDGSVASWSDADPSEVSLHSFEYTATAGQTLFSGVDNDGNTLSYVAGNERVYLNGVQLSTSDYTTTSSTSLTLLVGASLSDEVIILAFESFTLADHYTKAEVDAKMGAVKFNVYEYTATAGQTTFSGVDSNNETLAYTVGMAEVSYGGFDLPTADYTATNGTSIVLADGAEAGKIVRVVAFTTFQVADTVSASAGGTFIGNVNFSNGVDVTGTVTADGITSSNSLVIDNGQADGADIQLASTGYHSWFRDNYNGELRDFNNGKVFHRIAPNGDISFYEDTGTTPKFFWDASAEKLGIGTSSPDTKLHVKGVITAGDNSATSGSTLLESNYADSSNDNPNVLGTHHSSSRWSMGYGVRPKSGAGGYVSSVDNSNWTRGVLEVGNTLSFKNGVAQTTTVGNDVTLTDRFNIDSAGRVTMPYQPAFTAYYGGGNTVVSGNLVPPNTSVNTGSHYSTSTGRFTAPVAGVYQFTVSTLGWSSYGNGRSGFKVNGGYSPNFNCYQYARADDSSATSTYVVYLGVGDYAQAWSQAGCYSAYFHFSGHLIG